MKIFPYLDLSTNECIRFFRLSQILFSILVLAQLFPNIIGAGVGKYASQQYVIPEKHGQISYKDNRFIPNWWISYYIAGAGLAVAILPFSLFPRTLNGTKVVKKAKPSFSNLLQESKESIKRLFTTRIYVVQLINSLTILFAQNLLKGGSNVMFEEGFRGTLQIADAGIIILSTAIPAVFIVGGLFSYLRVPAKKQAVFNVICSGI